MKRTLATGLAAVLVATTVTATSGTAFARNNQWRPGPPPVQHHHNPPPYHGPGVAGPLLFGTFLGLALAPAFYPPGPPPPVAYPPVAYPRVSTHAAICQQWYGVWYNPATDLWQDSLGGLHRCTAPY